MSVYWTRHRRSKPPVDFFGSLIEPGDRFYYGMQNGAVGVVTKITGYSCEMRVRGRKATWPMKIRSPWLGVCLDKIPSPGEGSDPCKNIPR